MTYPGLTNSTRRDQIARELRWYRLLRNKYRRAYAATENERTTDRHLATAYADKLYGFRAALRIMVGR